MSFFARRKDAVRQLLMRDPGPAGRITGATQMLVSLAGVALIVLAPYFTLSPLMFAFVGAILGLFVTGTAEFVPNSAAVYRASLKALGLVLLTPIMVMMFVLAFRSIGA